MTYVSIPGTKDADGLAIPEGWALYFDGELAGSASPGEEESLASLLLSLRQEEK